MTIGTLDSFALILLFVLTVFFPLLGIWDFRRLLRWIQEGRADARIKSYRWILVMEWGLTLALLGWWLAAGRDVLSLGLLPAAAGWQWLTIGAGLAGVVFLTWQMVAVMRSPAKLKELRENMGELAGMAPTTDAEHGHFRMVAITAGICEEIIYRGLLLTVLTAAVGLWPAVALSSVIFGLGHAYQGWSGIARTFLVGVVMALLTVFSGSLFVAIILHIAADLTSGRMMSAALRAEPEMVA
jgi:membrane protease YdiL (CAAX protease family)